MPEKKETYLQKIEELVDLMEKRDLVEVEIIEGDNKIHLKRPQATVSQVPAVAVAPAVGILQTQAPGSERKAPIAESHFSILHCRF